MPSHHFLNGKHVLFFSPIQIQNPSSGGQWRTFSLMHEARELGAEVSIFSLTGRKKDYFARKKSGLIADKGFFEWVHRGRLAAFLQWVCYRLKLPPIWIPLYLSIWQPYALKKLLRRADVLVVDFPYGCTLFQSFNGFKVFSSHNAETVLWKNSFLRFFVQFIERQAIKEADLILHCSFNDRKILERLSPGRFVFRSNRTPKGRFRVLKPKETLRSELKLPAQSTLILFAGSAFQPNQEAVSFLRTACLEYNNWLESQRVKFLVVGSVSEPFRDKHILGTGRVDSIEPYFCAADAAINPVTSGSGSNVKIYEYRAAGLPILSTGFGVRGTAWKEGRDYFSFSRENFVESLDRFLKAGVPA